jgi:transcriptional regulator with XRE-family HTH domain
MSKLYENIKYYRVKNGLTQQDLADKAGYTSRSSIAKIEKGEVDLPQSKISIFAEIFHVTENELMGNPQKNDRVNAALKKLNERDDLALLFDKTKDLDPESVEAIVNLVDAIKKEKGI